MSLPQRSMRETPGKNAQLRRTAIQLAAQLPDDKADAVKVVEYLRQLVAEFMFDGDGALSGSARSPVASFPQLHGERKS